MTILNDLLNCSTLGLALLTTIIVSVQEGVILESVLLAPAIWLVLIGTLVTIITECLSVLHLLSHNGITSSWIITIILISARISRNLKRIHKPTFQIPNFRNWSNIQKISLLGVSIILAITLICGLFSPPNNYDSMTYHNARVMQWLDHGSLMNYYTPIDRQLRMPPLASYFKLHLYAILGNDYLFNSVQWVFFLTCILINAVWAWILTLNFTAVVFAVIFSATLPMAILQSCSTQNDLITAGYIISAGFLITFLVTRTYKEKTLKPLYNRIIILFWTCVGLGWDF